MTKTQQRILEAVDRNYRIEGGNLIGSKGEPLKIKLHGKQRYPTFSTNWGGEVFGIPVHLLAAYQFYGQKAFQKGIQVRHLNGDTLDFSQKNIQLGTSSDNQMDKCPDVRSNAARKARAAQGITPTNAKLSPAQVQMVRDYYTRLEGKKAPNGATTKLANQLGVSRTVLSKIKKGEYYVSC